MHRTSSLIVHSEATLSSTAAAMDALLCLSQLNTSHKSALNILCLATLVEKAVVCEESGGEGKDVVVKVSVLSNEYVSNLLADEKLYTMCISYFLRSAIKQAQPHSTLTLHLYDCDRLPTSSVSAISSDSQNNKSFQYPSGNTINSIDSWRLGLSAIS